MFHRLLRSLRRVFPAARQSSPPFLAQHADGPPLIGGFPDLDWSMRAANTVLDDARRHADTLVRSCPLGSTLAVRDLSFDRERGSLRLGFNHSAPLGNTAGPDPFFELVLAVNDAVTAENLEAAFTLGGLCVVLARAGCGRLLVEGLWEGKRYHIYGIPAVRSLLDTY
jgi:hypothetical protein